MYTWQIFTTFHNQSSLSMAFQVNRCRHHTPPVSGGPAVQSIHFKLHVAMVVGVGVTNVHTISLGCTYIYVSVWRHTGNVELEVWIWFKTTDPLFILVSHGFIPKMWRKPQGFRPAWKRCHGLLCVLAWPKDVQGLVGGPELGIYPPIPWGKDGKRMIMNDYDSDIGKGWERHIQLHWITTQLGDGKGTIHIKQGDFGVLYWDETSQVEEITITVYQQHRKKQSHDSHQSEKHDRYVYII